MVPIRNGVILDKSISYENISFDSRNHGRENLNIGLDDEMISISGKIEVFEGEFVAINLEASLWPPEDVGGYRDRVHVV